MNLTVDKTLKWMTRVNEKIQANKAYLTSLDQAIGDGDHGINMSRGFQEVVKKLSSSHYETVSDCFKDVAMTLMSKVGGASGPIFGTAFLKMSMSVKGKESINQEEFTRAIDDAINGIIQRGKANEGDKTLLDVWMPILRVFQENDDINWNDADNTAKNAMEATKERLAKKGRAAYLKERSIGHVDPGSVSSYYLFQSLAEVMTKGDKNE
ncbi:dihydroxyacetone kinase subunit L [Bacillus sporothermodurans]|uniref:dihydroxyacetone kinase subunit DhaL n=1 Tax=Heyndrickxia sporothermodurans TaxID=46224 RepID=UPI00192C6C57|nr:dihydroxyacetone kinase subunit DhaL [Heyndrickxia sporothermodurans]MBL5799575.1 dihydroxyacetone kinase subunit L [Heyndrickxia sporothermodurans]MBL5810644.1 dihydroxyacetone kinase subunit L [Heyndrickxia sporothermodurans]MBL5814173.1 dihydroxyacetone kinase subunit L [Heyndrickxia sporothermodurans]MBL5817592.1 dihydroxyacetone kinase subunit L [Heyndrickxia sporothermodurans]MBL5842807.1 dihydroxyacetone kinase subunit L [Heyndrickxia sporothermodurans]